MSEDHGDSETSGASSDPPRARPPARPARLGPLPRPLALALIAIWAIATIVAGVGLLRGPTPWSGELEGLVPREHRHVDDRTLAMLRVDLDALEDQAKRDGAIDPVDPRTILADAGFAIEEALGDERVPLAPPKTEITRWLDTHALYLLPIDTHDALAERLTDASMLAQVRGLEARLSSPLFAVSGEQPRRDPLGIQELTKREAGRLGHVAEIPGSDAPQVSASGDLIAASGDRALIALVSERPIAQLEEDLRAAVAELPVEVTLLDARVREAEVEALLADAAPPLLATCFAALILLLSIGLRRVLPVLGLGACLASIAVGVAWAAGLELGAGASLAGLEPGSIALLVLLLGFCMDAAASEGAGKQALISTLIVAAALAPLALVPYPLWQRWSLWWAAGFVALALVLRAMLPALLALVGASLEPEPAPPRPSLAPRPGLALAACLVLIGAGVWVAPQLRVRSIADPGIERASAGASALREHFFDPSMIVIASSSPDDASPELADDPSFGPEAAALDAAAQTTEALAELVPIEARRVDSPGSFVLQRSELEARREALAKLKLDERMEVLDLLLVDQGLRAEAFGEFVRGAANIDALPSAQVALDGPLGPWIRGYLVDTDEGPRLRTRVELRGREGRTTAPLSPERLASLPLLRGPAIAASLDEQAFLSRLGLAVIANLWLTAFLIWLGTGSLGVALSAACVALACQAGVLVGLSIAALPIGAHLLPVLMLTGASAGVVGARAQRGLLDRRRLLLASGCQLAAALALLASAQPLWRELGLAAAIGFGLAACLGLFATPSLAARFTTPTKAKTNQAKKAEDRA